MHDNIDFLRLAADRYSVRKFAEKPVEQEKLDKVLEAGHLAPTAVNYQPQRILVMNDEEALTKLQTCTRYHFNAPAALLVSYNKNECWKRAYDGKISGEIDASIVTTHMMLEAAAIGLGTTWVMYFDPGILRKEFSIPDELEPVALLILGYPADDAKPSAKHTEFRSPEEIISYNSGYHDLKK